MRATLGEFSRRGLRSIRGVVGGRPGQTRSKTKKQNALDLDKLIKNNQSNTTLTLTVVPFHFSPFVINNNGDDVSCIEPSSSGRGDSGEKLFRWRRRCHRRHRRRRCLLPYAHAARSRADDAAVASRGLAREKGREQGRQADSVMGDTNNTRSRATLWRFCSAAPHPPQTHTAHRRASSYRSRSTASRSSRRWAGTTPAAVLLAAPPPTRVLEAAASRRSCRSSSASRSGSRR